jgi:KDO2-lipid IV(A) lauroyltransferase
VDFFGEPAKMPPGPALLAATSGATLLSVHAFFAGDHGWGHSISAPIDLGEGRLRDRVARGAQLIADHFATDIARRPADWHMLQRLWLADLEPARD